jgi:CRP/FNR family transcriptional regulator, cyclic AMP receptor protein
VPVSALVLKQNAFFATLSQESLQWAADRMDIFSLKRRQALLSSGGPFKGLGMVLSGRMQAIELTMDGREVALKTIEQNGLFGQEDLLARAPLSLHWTAPASATVAVMGLKTAKELILQPEMLRALAADLAQQLNDQLQWQKILSANTVAAKLANWIVFSAGERKEVTLPTHAEVAWRLNTTRESVTRVLQRLQADGVLVREEGRWRIQKSAALKDLAKGDDHNKGEEK